MKNFLEEVVSAQVKPEHIRRIVEAAEAERSSADPTPAEFVILREFHGELSSHQIAAIMFRMEALADAIKERRTGKWVIEVLRQDYVLVSDAVLAAAALAPLNLPERGRPSFDMDRFLEIALEQSGAEGQG